MAYRKQRIDARESDGRVVRPDTVIARITLLYQSGIVTQEVAKDHIMLIKQYWGSGLYKINIAGRGLVDIREIETTLIDVESPMYEVSAELNKAAERMSAERLKAQGVRPRGAPRIQE